MSRWLSSQEFDATRSLGGECQSGLGKDGSRARAGVEVDFGSREVVVSPNASNDSRLASHVDRDEALASHDELVGATIGHYRLEALVGLGTMGRVYKAEHLGLHRPCAIKVMNPQLVASRPAIRERFWAEARMVARLLHPHVVTIHNLGTDKGYHYIEMEYFSGGVSLRETIIREGPFEPIRAANLVRQVALALTAAHESGLVHRDVKPGNVLMNDQDHAKLADFGLVRRFSELEREGVPIAGTPSYMAPELFEGVAASHRSDIYAAGVMLYYLLSARLPFAADQLNQLILRHRFEPVPDICELVPDVPDSIMRIIARCLAKNPADRYQSAEELVNALQRVIRDQRDTESLVRECIVGTDCFLQGARDHYRILIRLPESRLHEVYFEVSQGPGGERLVSLFAVCGPADPRNFEFALRLNDRKAYGTLSVRNIDGQPMFVMSRTFAREHASPADLRAAMLEIARRSDRLEHHLTDTDMY